MAAPKKPTHRVAHPRLFLAVEGKLQAMPVGHQLTLTDKQAKGLGLRVQSLKDSGTSDLSGDKEKAQAEKAE